MEYTREDVIIWPDDPRLKDAIGKKCYVADNPDVVLKLANMDDCCQTLYQIDENSNHIFKTVETIAWHFLILKKEPEKKYVPFDFSKKEDRDALIGKMIHREPKKNTSFEFEQYGIAYSFIHTNVSGWICVGYGDSKELFDNWTFADTGLPVGKEVEE